MFCHDQTINSSLHLIKRKHRTANIKLQYLQVTALTQVNIHHAIQTAPSNGDDSLLFLRPDLCFPTVTSASRRLASGDQSNVRCHRVNQYLPIQSCSLVFTLNAPPSTFHPILTSKRLAGWPHSGNLPTNGSQMKLGSTIHSLRSLL